MEKIINFILVAFAYVVAAKTALFGFVFYLFTDKSTKDEIKIGRAVVKAFLKEECKKLEIHKPILVIDPLNKKSHGCMLMGRVLFINPVGNNDILNTLRHELRHEWQHWHYGKVADWCWKNMSMRMEEDMTYYWLDFAEIDARYYAKTHGESGVFTLFSADQLDQMKQDETLLPTLYALAEECDVLPWFLRRH